MSTIGGPAVETFLGIIFLILLILGAIGWFLRPTFPRFSRFLKNWYERDILIEAEQKRQAEHRKTAEKEIADWVELPEGEANSKPNLQPMNITNEESQKEPQKAILTKDFTALKPVSLKIEEKTGENIKENIKEEEQTLTLFDNIEN